MTLLLFLGERWITGPSPFQGTEIRLHLLMEEWHMDRRGIAATPLEKIVCHTGNWDGDYIIYHSKWYYILRLGGIISNYTDITGANLDGTGHTMTYLINSGN